MQNNEVLGKIVAIIKPYVKNEPALRELSPSTRFIEDLKINSARLVDIVLAFEDEFNASITDEEAEKIQTIGDALDLIAQKLNQATLV